MSEDVDKKIEDYGYDSENKDIIVSGRPFEAVWNNLQLTEQAIAPGSKVLSVGEGLSDFARKLEMRTNSKVWALDLIYRHGTELFKQNPAEVYKYLSERYKGLLKPKLGNKNFPNRKQLIAGDIHDLPFSDSTLDLVIGSTVFEHLNLERALPELVRVLKNSGELRLSGCLLDLIPAENKLYPARVAIDGYGGDAYVMRAKNVVPALQWLIQQEGLTGYIVADQPNHRTEGVYKADVLVIRKDQNLPLIKQETNTDIDDLQRYPFIGKTYKIEKVGSEKSTNRLYTTTWQPQTRTTETITIDTFSVSEVA
ncbi:MAG: hypothetical protein A3A58_00275 [Candidatus Blackburnbacteria bacterium RIFCSPLOWO2_01_FULL_41_27]|uniref:Methyltransferase type 11 domain-containing protein n=2 Tax=Candidatus Blackburniibacteriota TaxID=1817898 RepID=A0A1G1VC54_9BACT|nr:MAG: hypothetical protein A3A58_00275 [Candidatus Blackburnbacteria bacterium RIFCSPLOWO2_01_FULL_41_27]OGY12921.1 MAG: hypothetical protein A3F61_00660 [Candidatus Blackburnbacteria bacterium RIFCSPHIGHO2_12_FULL_41_13b]